MSAQPGWYPDESGLPILREWDGSKWTGQSKPLPGPSANIAPAASEVKPSGKTGLRKLAAESVAFRLALVLTPVAILAGIVWAGSNANPGPSSEPAPEYASSAEVEAQCEARIERLLKSPSTAEFDSSASGFKSWKVTGTVDSQNGFGAMVRSSYQCTVVDNLDGTLTTTVDSLDE